MSRKLTYENGKFVRPYARPPLESELKSGPYWGRKLSKKNFNDTIWNRNRCLSACSAVSRPNGPPRDSTMKINITNILDFQSCMQYIKLIEFRKIVFWLIVIILTNTASNLRHVTASLYRE